MVERVEALRCGRRNRDILKRGLVNTSYDGRRRDADIANPDCIEIGDADAGNCAVEPLLARYGEIRPLRAVMPYQKSFR